jgi:hypothetical protein
LENYYKHGNRERTVEEVKVIETEMNVAFRKEADDPEAYCILKQGKCDPAGDPLLADHAYFSLSMYTTKVKVPGDPIPFDEEKFFMHFQRRLEQAPQDD